jgi:hypothetical protein
MNLFTKTVEVEKPITMDRVVAFLKLHEITNAEAETLLAIII